MVWANFLIGWLDRSGYFRLILVRPLAEADPPIIPVADEVSPDDSSLTATIGHFRGRIVTTIK